MPTKRHPRRGSLQYWPRKRIRKIRIRNQTALAKKQTKTGLLGFPGYKAGMTHIIMVDQGENSLTKGEQIVKPVTVVECPPIKIIGIRFYQKKDDGIKLVSEIIDEKQDKFLLKKISKAKKTKNKITDIEKLAKQIKAGEGIKAGEEIEEKKGERTGGTVRDIRLVVEMQPHKIGIKKKADLIEVGLGGKFEEKINFAKENFGKQIDAESTLEAGELVDVHGITKGKGFQGAAKRFGVPLLPHKSEKSRRGPANLGPWTPKKVSWRVAQGGKMGCHRRTAYNKQVLKIGEKPEEVNPAGGFINYGLVKNSYVLVSGSVPGLRKRMVVLTKAGRPKKRLKIPAPEIKNISLISKQRG